MEWVGALGGQLLTAGISFLFFWTLVGQYAYREAKAEDRSMPKRRGLCWGVLGIVGVIDYLRDIENRDESRLGWIGFAAVLFAFWMIDPVVRQEPAGWYAWAGMYTGLFVLYWQFDLEVPTVAGR